MIQSAMLMLPIEAGGITQHIGAYTVNIKNKIITFWIPGSRGIYLNEGLGAQVTDIAVLVVAADDGVMPQTVKPSCQGCQCTYYMAINKMDKPSANPDRVKQELLSMVW